MAQTDNKEKQTEQKSDIQNKNEQVSSEKNDPQANSKATQEQAEDKGQEKKEKSNADLLAEAQKTIDDLKDRYLRTAAEFDNYKKRTLREKIELRNNGGAEAITAILPVLDDFERALSDKSDDPKIIKEGMQMIFKKFIKALESMGVKKIDTQDKDFNTDYHEAVALVPGLGDDKKGKVIDCVQTGYTMNDKVLRHAKVAVGQ